MARTYSSQAVVSIRSAGREHAIVDPRIVEGDMAVKSLPALIRLLAGALGLRQTSRPEPRVSEERGCRAANSCSPLEIVLNLLAAAEVRRALGAMSGPSAVVTDATP